MDDIKKIASIISEDPDIDIYGLGAREEPDIPTYAKPSWPQELWHIIKDDPMLEKAFKKADDMLDHMGLQEKFIKLTPIFKALKRYIDKGIIKGWPEIEEYLYAVI